MGLLTKMSSGRRPRRLRPARRRGPTPPTLLGLGSADAPGLRDRRAGLSRLWGPHAPESPPSTILPSFGGSFLNWPSPTRERALAPPLPGRPPPRHELAGSRRGTGLRASARGPSPQGAIRLVRLVGLQSVCRSACRLTVPLRLGRMALSQAGPQGSRRDLCVRCAIGSWGGSMSEDGTLSSGGPTDAPTGAGAAPDTVYVGYAHDSERLLRP